MAKIKFEAIDDNSTEYLDSINDDIVDNENGTAEIDSEELSDIDSDEIGTSDEIETSDGTEKLFYANEIYNELRDAMQDTDFRLYLLNNDLVIPGTLGEKEDEIKFLDIVGEGDDEEFVLKDAPKDLVDVLSFKTLYNLENADIEIPEGIEVSEPPHEKIVEYILNLKVTDQDTDDIEDDEEEIDKKETEKEVDIDETNEE